MRVHLITIFPEMIELAARFGVVGQAIQEGRIEVRATSPRAFTTNVHQTVDDRPFGGGDGMVMIAEPLEKAVAEALQAVPEGASRRVIHLSPRGVPFSDQKARELAGVENLILIASRYGGVDQRFLNACVDEEISIGDYVLSGGELPGLVILDAIARLKPGVLGNERSSEDESFAEGLLEQPQYTRPREWQGAEVPAELLSGDHAKIEIWKKQVALLVTAERRPELLSRLTPEAVKARLVRETLELQASADEGTLRLWGLAPALRDQVRGHLEALYKRLPPEKRRR
jgi:tRNA (guanine37-N1)-methyltransferase